MKTSALCITACTAILSQSAAFTCTTVPITSHFSSRHSLATQTTATPTSLSMFSGGALSIEEEEDDEKRSQIEQMAKAMGMTVEEYQLGIRARERMEKAINDLRVVGGDEANGVTVERDGNMPPRHLVVRVTDQGKAQGKATLEKLLVEALKSAGEKSKVGRDEAQKDMMKYISESYKKLGMK